MTAASIITTGVAAVTFPIGVLVGAVANDWSDGSQRAIAIASIIIGVAGFVVIGVGIGRIP